MPPSDSPGGAAIGIAALFVVVYVVLFLATYNTMVATALWITSVALLAGIIATFSLGSMMGTDIATFQRLELDLARTVLAHLGSNDAPGPEAPLAGIWRAYVAVADESRRVSRVHAYAFGAFFYGTLFSLGSSLLVAMGVLSSTNNVIGLALLVELVGFAFLFMGAMALVLSVGYPGEVAGFHRLAARRWRRNSARLPAVEEALSNVAWLPEFHRGVRESQTHPRDSTLKWITP
jgi:hypothetical protein